MRCFPPIFSPAPGACHQLPTSMDKAMGQLESVQASGRQGGEGVHLRSAYLAKRFHAASELVPPRCPTCWCRGSYNQAHPASAPLDPERSAALLMRSMGFTYTAALPHRPQGVGSWQPTLLCGCRWHRHSKATWPFLPESHVSYLPSPQ